MFNVKWQTEDCILWIKSQFKNNGGKVAVIGISGGKDSSVCAALCVNALGKENVIGVKMPNGTQADISDSDRLIDFLGIKGVEINIGEAFKCLSEQMKKSGFETNDRYKTNTPARLRMTSLYGVAACIDGARVCNTCNLSEDILGYSTLYGDSAGDFSPISDFTVSEVLEIGDYLGLPLDLVHKAPSDGMCGSTDEQNISRQEGINFTYEKFDKIIRGIPTGMPHDEEFAFKQAVYQRFLKNDFKNEIIRIPRYYQEEAKCVFFSRCK